MQSTMKICTGAAAMVAAIALGGPSAEAGQLDAFTLYAGVVQADVAWNAADTSAAVGDNITCDPAPVVDGRMVNPRAGAVVGEVYAQAEMVGHLKCVSLDTGASYTLTGTITDYYLSGGAYRRGVSSSDPQPARLGAVTTNPRQVVSYVGGSAALNTWHYAGFVGTTTTGRVIRGSSPLFYVAGV